MISAALQAIPPNVRVKVVTKTGEVVSGNFYWDSNKIGEMWVMIRGVTHQAYVKGKMVSQQEVTVLDLDDIVSISYVNMNTSDADDDDS